MIGNITKAALGAAVWWAILGQPAQADTIDDYVREQMQRRHIPGVSIAVVRDGKVIRSQGYGMANVELSVPATENTVYQLASVTKQFTATAIMMLVDEGIFSLDDRITRLLPGLPATWDAVTIRQLLSHTSGIKSYTSVDGFEKTARKDYAHAEIIDLVAKDPLEFTPGESWNYSNTNYFLLGMLIEKITGKTYGAFLDERIFQPLGMTHTQINDLKMIVPNRAQGYGWDGTSLRNGEYVSPTQPFAAGALLSTVSDLVKWDAALDGEKLLKKSRLEQMWTPTPLGKGGTAGYGFGWEVSKVNDHRLISHGGGIPGFSTQISRFVDDRLTIIVLTNSDTGDAGRMAQGIAGRVLPELAAKPEPAIADPDPKTTELVKKALQGVMQGEMSPEFFTNAIREKVGPWVRDMKETNTGFGALRTFELLERKATDQGIHLRYRVVFAKQSMMASFDLNKESKIADMMLRLEE